MWAHISLHTRSVASSSRSSASTKARAAAKKAALEVRAVTLQGLHELQLEELKLQQKRAEIDLRVEIAEADAERIIYEDAEANENHPHVEEANGQSSQAALAINSSSTPRNGISTEDPTDKPAVTPLSSHSLEEKPTYIRVL